MENETPVKVRYKHLGKLNLQSHNCTQEIEIRSLNSK